MKSVYPVLLILWFILGALICKTCICPDKDGLSKTEAALAAKTSMDCASLNLKDGDFELSSAENFKFALNDATQQDISDDFTIQLGKLKDYMMANSDRFMRITGYYTADETNSTEFDNLGIARARNIKEFMKTIGIDGAQLNSAGEMLESDCIDDGVIQKGISVKFGQIPTN